MTSKRNVNVNHIRTKIKFSKCFNEQSKLFAFFKIRMNEMKLNTKTTANDKSRNKRNNKHGLRKYLLVHYKTCHRLLTKRIEWVRDNIQTLLYNDLSSQFFYKGHKKYEIHL